MPVARKKKNLTHNFEWPMPVELTMEQAKDVGLVKGVLMREGKLKSGEIETAHNVRQGGGSLRAAAILGAAGVDVDHIKDKLPEKYTKKYGEHINDDYPPAGAVLDAEVVEGEDGKVEVQAIMSVAPWLYDLIANGDAKGNSVEETYRKLSCEDGEDCQYEGGAYLYNTIIVEEVPNADGTWVAPVDEDDIGTIISHSKTRKHMNTPVVQYLNKRLKAAHSKKTVEHADGGVLADYMTDGYWNDGKDSIEAFFVKSKDMDQSTAKAMAAYLFANPTKLSQYQLEHHSAADLMAWWLHAKLDGVEQSVQHIAKQLHQIIAANPNIKQNTIQYIEGVQKHSADEVVLSEIPKVLRHIKTQSVQYGQGEVDYGEAIEGEQCVQCRNFSPHDLENPTGTGECLIVSGDVQGSYGCKKFDQNPTMTEPPEEEQPMEDEEGEPADSVQGDGGEEEIMKGKDKQTEPVPHITVAKHAAKPYDNTKHQKEIWAAEQRAKIKVLTEQKAKIGMPWNKREQAVALERRQDMQREIDELIKALTDAGFELIVI